MAPLVLIVIPVFNCLGYTKQCLDSLFQNTPRSLFDLVIVDNGSSDGTGEYLRKIPRPVSIVTNPQNQGFAGACNQGARKARGKYLLFLNNDTQPEAHWLEELVAVAESDPTVGIVGSKLLFPDGTVQHAGVVFFNDLTPIHLYADCPGQAPWVNKKRCFDAVTAACMLIPSQVFESAGHFDEEYTNGLEDIDLCLKVRKSGRKIVYCPTSVLIHHEAATPGRDSHVQENVRLFQSSWNNTIHQDDYVFLDEDSMEIVFKPGSRKPVYMSKEEIDKELLPQLKSADTLCEQMQLDKALNIYIQLCRVCPNRVDFLGRTADVALKLRKFDLAVQAAQRILNQRPDDAMALAWLKSAKATQ